MHKYKLLLSLIIAVLSLGSSVGHSNQLTAIIHETSNNKTIGHVVFTENDYGLIITPQLTDLKPGLHGVHLHQHPNCGDHGNNAGAHYDPQQTNSHQGPYGKGHLGDLPVLYVSSDGKASTPTLAPRLKLNDLKGLAFMIHANGDNYSDNPPLGGGGPREACGLIEPSNRG